MADVERRSFSLTPELVAVVDTAVESGEFGNVSEVVREALRQWNDRRDPNGYTVEELRRLWDQGLASGAPVDGEEAFARIRERMQNVTASPGA